jgi:predicted DNA-binding protein
LQRTTIFLTEEQREQLAVHSQRTGAPIAALVRKAIDESLYRLNREAQPPATSQVKTTPDR